MVDIKLNESSDSYPSGNDTVNVSKKDFDKNFHKVTYEIKYLNSFTPSLWNSFFYSTTFNVYIRYKRDRNPFIYYVINENDVVREVEVYYSKHYTNVPLIIGFKRDENSQFKYYTFTFLAQKGNSNRLASGDGFYHNDLLTKLQYENNNRNKIKFVTEDGKSQNYDEIQGWNTIHGVRNSVFYPLDDEKYGHHAIATDRLFSKNKLTDRTILDKTLSGLANNTFYSVTIYFIESNNVVLMIQFEDDSGKQQYQRQDVDGLYWSKISVNYNYETELDPYIKSIKEQYETIITYQLEKIQGNYANKKIDVSKSDQSSYSIYNHCISQKHLSTFKKTLVLYNGTEITVVNNHNITGQVLDKLEPKKIQESMFKEISTYILNTSTSEHLIIKLTKQDSTNYYLHRFNKDGTKWRQVGPKELEDAGIDVVSLTEEKNLDKLLVTALTEATKWKLLLDYIRFIINSLVVLINHISQYNNVDIEKIVGGIGSEKEVPPIDINTNIINVTDETSKPIAECIKSNRYNIHSHNLQKSGKSGKEKAGDNSDLYLRLYLDGKMILLYDSENDNRIPTYLVYSPGKDYLYVYFYAHGSTVPILLCYEGKAYRAKDKDSYHSKWILETSINDCVCKDNSENSTNDNLISGLNKCKFPNVLFLYEKTGFQSKYNFSKLFTSYHHQQDDFKSGDIDIYKKSDAKKLILKAGGSNANSVLSYATVYFNIYDSTNTPLLVTFRFNGQNKYYKLSEFEYDLNKGGKDISSLNQLSSDHGILLRPLIEENEKSLEILTYDIEKTSSNTRGKYNKDKINVIDDTRSISDLKKNGFKKYKHTPANGYDAKNSCVIHESNVLFYWSETEKTSKTIDHIQGKVLKSLSAYFTDKLKEPLFLAFEINQTNSVEWKYYYQKKDKGKLYFQILDRQSSNVLLGKYTEENKIRNELIEKQENLIQILKILEFFAVNTVVFLIEKQGVSYSKIEVDDAIIKTEPRLTPNSKSTDAQPDTINLVKDRCLQSEKYGYHRLSHNIKLNGLFPTAELRLLTPTSSRNCNYSEINLYNSESHSDPIILKYSNVQSKLYVYFYGDDPRPLLLSYNGAFYRPKNKTDYDNYKWTKINVNTCESNSTNDSLPKVLTEAIGYLTEVQLKYNHLDSYNVHLFNGKQIEVKTINQIITASELSRSSCYKKLTHRPNGHGSGNWSGFRLGDITYSNPESNGSIRYYSIGSNQSSHKWEPLVKVISYFYDRDDSYKDPLLVELEFKTTLGPSHNEYYRLSKKDTKLEWQRDLNAKNSLESGGEKLVNYLEGIRYTYKKVLQVRIDKTNAYDLKASGQPAGKGQFVSLGGTGQVQVSEETPCTNLNGYNYKCLKHQLSSLSGDQHYQIGSLKLIISQELSKEGPISSGSDQNISLYNVKNSKEWEVIQRIKEKEDKDKNKEKRNLYKEIEHDLEEYTPVYYTSCMGDLYVYFYHPNSDKIEEQSKGDPRPGLVCFDRRAYRPIKLPEPKGENYNYANNEDYISWIRVSDITNCGCQEQDKLIEVLNDVYNIETLNIALIAGSSAGGLAGVASIGGIGFLIFKKVASAAVTAATAASVSI